MAGGRKAGGICGADKAAAAGFGGLQPHFAWQENPAQMWKTCCGMSEKAYILHWEDEGVQDMAQGNIEGKTSMEGKYSKDKEIQQFRNRFHDLAEKSFQQGIFTFTGFLGLSEQDVFWQEEAELRYAGYSLKGGFEDAERVVIRFGNSEELGYEVPFPIVCIHISPLAQKFADELSHRDFLGALMNLGIERSTIGDIKTGEKQAYLFCLESIADFICENLEQVKHTHIKCAVTTDYKNIPREEPVPTRIQVPSLRVDAVLAKVYNMSREKSQELFRRGKVYVDGRLCENHSRQLKAGETVNARGYGKFTLTGEGRETKKGRLSVEAAVYR